MSGHKAERVQVSFFSLQKSSVMIYLLKQSELGLQLISPEIFSSVVNRGNLLWKAALSLPDTDPSLGRC